MFVTDPFTRTSLNLDIKKDDYFFDNKKPNEVFILFGLSIEVYDIVRDVNRVIFRCSLSKNGIPTLFEFHYMHDEMVYYGPVENMGKIRALLFDDFTELDVLTNAVIEAYIPGDFWEVGRSVN